MKPWSSLVIWLGAVALLFAIVSFLVEIFSSGVIFAGSPAQLLAQFSWSVLNLVVGLALLGAGLFTNLDVIRERMRSGEARRAGKYGTSAVVGTILGVALLGMLAFLSTRYHTRWDWTEAKSHSLTSQTVKVLKGLEREVDVTALYTDIAAEPVRELLDRYTFEAQRLGVADKFKVEFVDPQGQPGRVAALGVDAGHIGNGVLHVAIGPDHVDVSDPDEAGLTNAIVKLTRQEQKKVYFLDGHNERIVQGNGADDREGFSFAAEALRNENYQVDTLLLAATGDVPSDANVVIIAGPTRPLHESEHAALERYVEKGGALFVMLDPRAKTDLYGQVKSWGVDVGDDVVVDRVQGLFGRPTTPFAASYADHPITRELHDAALFHVVRSVEPDPAAGKAFVTLVRTGDQSWAETDWDRLTKTGQVEFDKGQDKIGPVSVAVAGTVAFPTTSGEGEAAKTGPQARLVVFGDSDFATNQFLREFGNRDLFVNTVNWLLGDVDAISIRPGKPRASRLELTAGQFQRIRTLALFVMPEAIALLGVVAWWRRRRAPGR